MLWRTKQRRFAVGEPGEFGQLAAALAAPASKTSTSSATRSSALARHGPGDRAGRRRLVAGGSPAIADFGLRSGAMSAVCEIFFELAADGFGVDRLPGRLGQKSLPA